MKNKTKFLFILFIICLIGFLISYYHSQNFVQYDNPHNQYSILYPSEWVEIEGSKETFDIIFAPQKNKKLDSSIEQLAVKTVEIKLQDKTVNIDEIVKSLTNKPEFKVLSVKDLTIKDQPTKLITYSRKDNERTNIFQTTILSKGSNVYLLTFMCKEGEVQQYAKLVNKVFGSFTIK